MRKADLMDSRKTSLKGKQGFSLIEVIIAVVILGILTAIAVPSFYAYIQQGAAQNAQNNLETIYNLQKNYYLNNGKYCINSCDNLADINANLSLSLSDNYYIYTCACAYSSSCGTPSIAYCYAQLSTYPHTFLYETAGTPIYGMNTSSTSSGTMSCGSLAGSEGKVAKQCNSTADTCTGGWTYLGQTFDCPSCCGT